MEGPLVALIVGGAIANVGMLGVAWLNLRGKSVDLSRELHLNTDRLKAVESKVDSVRADLAAHDGSIRVLNTEIQHLTNRHDDLSKRFDANVLKRIEKVERQVVREGQ